MDEVRRTVSLDYRPQPDSAMPRVVVEGVISPIAVM
jgi:hypothetical protein